MKRSLVKFAYGCLVVMLVILVYGVLKCPEHVESIARAFLVLFEAIEKVMLL